MSQPVDDWVPWQCPRCGKKALANLARLGPLGMVRCTCGSTSKAYRQTMTTPEPCNICQSPVRLEKREAPRRLGDTSGREVFVRVCTSPTCSSQPGGRRRLGDSV